MYQKEKEKITREHNLLTKYFAETLRAQAGLPEEIFLDKYNHTIFMYT